MKSPANAARLKLHQALPHARYVYLARNPLNVFPSTVKLWRALYSVQGLHNPPELDPWLDDYVLDMFARLTEAYEEDKHLIPKDRLVEMRYEDFVKDLIASMRDIYGRLDIPGFDQAEAADARLPRRASGAQSVAPDTAWRPSSAKCVDRLKTYIDRFGYREAVDAAALRSSSVAAAAGGGEPSTKAPARAEPS